MGTPYFRFRQFVVWHDRCAHRVGTDGVLLGAWASLEGHRRILDIGTGSGLIALMAAQRNEQACVVALEIDEAAAGQARENVAHSPFARRIKVVQADVRDFVPTASEAFGNAGAPVAENAFDCILCNPPFFTEDTLPDNSSRALARNAAMLSFDELLQAVRRLLSADGEFHVILPVAEAKPFVDKALLLGFCVTRQCLVRTVVSKPPRRSLLSFSRSGGINYAASELVLQNPDGSRSADYSALMKNFYL